MQKILFIHAWNKNGKSYRGIFSRLMTYPSLTLPTLVSLVPEDIESEIDVCDEISHTIDYDKKNTMLCLFPLIRPLASKHISTLENSKRERRI